MPPENLNSKTHTEILEGIFAGEKRSVARLFNLLEDRREEKVRAVSSILDELYRRSLDRSHVIGITGPPGVGKSSLLSRMIQALRSSQRTVGLIAVDPSSRISQGALLGDRIRLEYDAADPGVFVRSMASRGDYGGISDRTFAGMLVLRSAFDLVLVETVGVGQSESDITSLVDTTLLVIQPGSGDMLQFLKAGLMEKPHLLIVNKADQGETARRTLNELRSAFGHLESTKESWNPKVLLASALESTGIHELLGEADRHLAFLKAQNLLPALRERQAAEWIWQSLVRLHGSRGAARFVGGEKISTQLHQNPKPFQILESLLKEAETQIDHR